MVSVSLATPAHKRVSRAKHATYSDQRAKRIGETLLRLINGSVAFQNQFHYFTRETLLQHFGDSAMFGRVSTIYRYNMMREGITYLLSIGTVEKPKEGAHYLCLAKQSKQALRTLNNKVPLEKRYFGNIKDTVLYCLENNTATVDTLMIAAAWQHRGTAPSSLTMDELRVLTRRTLHEMVKQDLLIEHPDYSYTLKA